MTVSHPSSINTVMRISSAQCSPLSCVWLFVTPWTAARQASLFITISRSLLKLMSIESVRPSNHLVLCHPLQSFPESGSFPVSQLFASGGQSIGVSPSTSVLSKNILDWIPLGLIGWISLQPRNSQLYTSNTKIKACWCHWVRYFL